MKQNHIRENSIYIALWLVLLLAPVISMYMRNQADVPTFHWNEILDIWKVYAAYLMLFLIHNFVIAPILVKKRKNALYFGLSAGLLLMFIGYQYTSYLERKKKFEKRFEIVANRMEEMPLLKMPPKNMPPKDIMPKDMPHKGMPPKDINKDQRVRPPFMFPGGPEVISIIMAILLLGMNLGVKLYFYSAKREKEMLLLEQQNLNSQLEYLKYQINPHFFMNTLNNIHALVDIDPELAKQTVIQLSKMMRYVLYEGNKKFVPMQSEYTFIENYVKLMSLRYDSNKIDIKSNTECMANSQLMVPPLLIINFVENAFKHGVSYQNKSFIHINAIIENNKLTFECSNSKHNEKKEEHGGVGLANTRKRLNLLFGKNYKLEINNTENVYDVKLNIPLKQ